MSTPTGLSGALSRRVVALRDAVLGVVGSAVDLVLGIVLVVSLALVVVWVGIPATLVVTALARPLTDLRRRVVGTRRGRPIPSPYLRADGHLLARFRAVVLDPAFRRDAVWLLVDGTFGLALAIVSLVEAVLDLVFWWLPVALARRLRDELDAALLSVSEKSRLALRVQQLADTRAETLDVSAAELRRIERDLHDGAQARLVALGMGLAMAEETLERDPAAARALLGEAREMTGGALADLRSLVRGIHPPVLADRGVVEALRAVALELPLPVAVTAAPGADTGLPAPVESAAYFATVEVLTNVVKHAGAARAEISVDRAGDRLTVSVEDDGAGGAQVRPGGGLDGVARRLAAFDGTLAVTSPSGGPTTIVMVLPCVSSSPRTSPSSVTG